ncbi:MAG: hypothetical protein KDJ26_08745 [Alphaproteobacteria bacterium]|nr:hypothetical protein [Alphaproteobacteria bacterium]MCB1552066.1 hypothetical protein [Alphaproteobacteria bacterium]MCB9984740.1 hypothetical protein [Micavibrio sp.]HRK98517.1 hypothetical protein [Alphaproteobacteria bacterium]
MSRAIKIFTLLLMISLTSCSTVTEGSMQQVTFETPNAEGAICTAEIGVNRLKYIIRPPQTVWIKKSSNDMSVSCEASGLREMKKIVESKTAPSTFLNVFNGILPGAVIDGDSGAMYKYPEKVVIDFAGIVATSQPMPPYHNLDGLNPTHESTVEDMGPDTPAIRQDSIDKIRHDEAYDQFKREQAEAAALEAEKQSRIDSLDGGFYGDKGASKGTH